MPPQRGKELTPTLRARICELRYSGMSYGKIATQVSRLGRVVNRSTVQATCEREIERVDNASKPRTGRPRVISEEERDKMYDIIEHEDPFIKWRDLVRVCETAHERSVRRLFADMNRRKWRCHKRPHLEAEHAAARYAWAIRYLHFQKEDWRRVVWSDECSIERGKGSQPRWTFQRPCEQLQNPKWVQTRNCGKGVRKMFWAAFGWMKRTSLVPMNGDPDSERGGVSSRVYKAVLEEHLPTILEADSIFMQDGAGIHRARIIKEFFTAMGIIVMDWPPYSPDLNPIENLWAILKAAIYKRYPDLEHAPNTDETLDRLIDAAMEVWDSIRDEILCNLSDKMPQRVEAVYNAEGWYTKY